MVDGWSTSFHIGPILGRPDTRPRSRAGIRRECRVHAEGAVPVGAARTPGYTSVKCPNSAAGWRVGRLSGVEHYKAEGRGGRSRVGVHVGPCRVEPCAVAGGYLDMVV